MFRFPADRQAATLEKYRDQWIKREGRQPQQTPERELHREITHDGLELDL